MLLDRARRALLSLEARRAEQDGDWWAAAGLWRRIVRDLGDDVTTGDLKRLGVLLRRAGDAEAARAVLERAVAADPDDPKVALQLAYAAILDQDWEAATELSVGIVDRFEGDAPATAWRRAIEMALRTDEDGTTAAELLDRARRWHADDPELLVAEARIATDRGDHEVSLRAWMALLETGRAAPATAYAHAARELSLIGDTARALEVAREGAARHPGSGTVQRLLGGLALHAHDWEGALRAWSAYAAQSGLDEQVPKLPPRSGVGLWHSGHWVRAAEAVATGSVPTDALGSPLVWVAVARNAARRSSGAAARLLGVAPEVEIVTAWRTRFEIDAARPAVGRPSPIDVGDTGVVDALRRALDTVGEVAGDEWGPVPVVAVERGSAAEHELQALRHLDRTSVEQLVERLIEDPAWVELRDGVAVVEQQAREMGAEFARRYSSELRVPDEALVDALQLLLQQALFTLEPTRRIADALAAEDDATPVLVEMPSWNIPLFDANDAGHFWPITLVSSLRRLGVPAAGLVYRPPGGADRSALGPFRFAVSPTLLAVREVEHEPEPGASAAVFPSGIRSLVDVIDEIDEPLVLAGDAIVGSFAYDRTHRARVEYAPTVNSVAERSMFGTRLWPLHRVDWQSHTPGMDVWATAPLGADLLGLARELLGDHFAETYRRTAAVLEEYGIDEAHVADHHYPGSGLFAGAMRDRGGRVVLWPHSTNPVHVTARPGGSFAEVSAITANGAEAWRAQHPEAVVHHRPDLMLGWSTEPAPVDPDAPVSVIVLGGKPVLGLMPFIDLEAHDRAVASFFRGLERLRADGLARIVFKAKGGGVGGPGWLDGLVGDEVQYEIENRHPLRLDLPNMVFVTISLGSSAIYEGISRAVPGLVVRDFPVVDYTTLRDGAVPIRRVDEALEVVRSCCTPAGRSALADAQVAALTEEIGVGPSWASATVAG